MPKGKESISRQRKKFNNLTMVELKSSIKKMADFASSTSSTQDSFADKDAIATFPANNNHMEISVEPDVKPAKTSDQIKIPKFQKKVHLIQFKKFF